MKKIDPQSILFQKIVSEDTISEAIKLLNLSPKDTDAFCREGSHHCRAIKVLMTKNNQATIISITNLSVYAMGSISERLLRGTGAILDLWEDLDTASNNGQFTSKTLWDVHRTIE